MTSPLLDFPSPGNPFASNRGQREEDNSIKMKTLLWKVGGGGVRVGECVEDGENSYDTVDNVAR